MNLPYNLAQMDFQDYDSVAKTLTHKESEFPLIINRNQPYQFTNFRNNAQIVDLEVEPRDKSLKQADKLTVINKMKDHLKERLKLYVLPSSTDSIYIGFKLYNIDSIIKLHGSSIYHDFIKVEQVVDKQDNIKGKWFVELGYKLTFKPYNDQEPYKNLKNECFFSFSYECSTANSTITILAVRIAEDKSVFVL